MESDLQHRPLLWLESVGLHFSLSYKNAYKLIDVAFSQGILMGGGVRTMQTLQSATHVVMDKTGTLTEGRLQVIDSCFDQDLKLNRNLCYRLLAGAEVEEARVHPVAKAVFKWALSNTQQGSDSISGDAVSDTRDLKRELGRGVRCEVRAHSDEWIMVHVGQLIFLEEHGIAVPKARDLNDTQASMVHFAFAGRYGGHVCVRDTLRSEASVVVASLLQDGIEITMVRSTASLFTLRSGLIAISS